MAQQSKKPTQASRSTLLHLRPEDLILVADENQLLHDPRVDLPYDEKIVRNIMTHGVINPVTVRLNGPNIEVIAGRGRVKATIEANKRLEKEGKEPVLVPVIPRKGDDADIYGILISENECRREDSAVNRYDFESEVLANLRYRAQPRNVSRSGSLYSRKTVLGTTGICSQNPRISKKVLPMR
jgi:ParB family chromosome partitioning protein